MVLFSSRRQHTRWPRDWSSVVCSSDLARFLGELSEETAVRTRRNGVDAEMKLITRRLPIDLDLHVDTSALYALSHYGLDLLLILVERFRRAYGNLGVAPVDAANFDRRIDATSAGRASAKTGHACGHGLSRLNESKKPGCGGNPAQGGEGGIRTHGTGLRYTRFPGEPLQPLGHLSFGNGRPIYRGRRNVSPSVCHHHQTSMISPSLRVRMASTWLTCASVSA